MIIWIIIGIILVSVGLFIFLSGDDTADSLTPNQQVQPGQSVQPVQPPITFSSNRSSVSEGGNDVIFTISYPSGMSGTVSDGRGTTWSPTNSDQLTIRVTSPPVTFTLSVVDGTRTYNRFITIATEN